MKAIAVAAAAAASLLADRNLFFFFSLFRNSFPLSCFNKFCFVRFYFVLVWNGIQCIVVVLFEMLKTIRRINCCVSFKFLAVVGGFKKGVIK